jgi:hypothetical protein
MTIVSRRAWYGLVALCALTASLLFTSTPAFAGKIHVFGSTFGKEGSGSGEFKEPSGVAVNEVALGFAGDVYVVDAGNNRVQWFSPEGKEFKGVFDGTATPAKSFSSPNAIAIDNSTNALDPSIGDVYVVDSGHNVVDKFDPEGNYLGQIATGAEGAALGEIFGVAVDPQGVVWVYQASKEIDSYDDALSNALLSSTVSPFGTSPGFAVDSEDHLYVNRGALQFAKLSSTGETIVDAINPEPTATAATVDTLTDDVYIDETSMVGVYDPTAGLVERFDAGHVAESHGVAVDAQSGLAYASNHEADTISVFETVHIPTVLTGEGMGLSESTATLNGTVDPEGVEVSSCTFEYGRTREYGETAACSPAPGSGAGPVAVSAAIGGLELARYHFRITAVNANGETHSPDHTFVIASKPTLSSEALQGVSANTATVSAHINPNGLPTTYQVEYGTSTSYGSSSPEASLPAAFTPAGIQVTLSGLTPGTTYHARITASNEHGTAQGAQDIAFTTAATGGPVSASSCPNRTLSGFTPSLPDCRAYEFVSGGGGPGEIYPPEGPETLKNPGEDVTTEVPMRAAAAGGSVAYVAEAGEIEGSGASGLGLGNQFLATRGASGWGVSNITPQISESEVIPQSPVYAAYSPDLSLGIFSSNSAALSAAASPHGPAGCYVLYSRAIDGAFHALFSETQTPGECGKPMPPETFLPQNLLYAGANTGTPMVAAGTHLLFQSPAPLVAGVHASEPQTHQEEEEKGSNLYESVGGVVKPVSVLENGEPDANASFGAPPLPRPGSDVVGSRPDLANVISADGSRIFWTDLTTGKIYERVDQTSTVAVSEGAATYWDGSADGRYVFYTEGEALLRFDTQTGMRETLVGSGAGVQGVAGISEDGAYVYFVAQGALAAGAEVRKCTTALADRTALELSGKGTIEEIERFSEEKVSEEHGHLPAGRGCNVYVSHGGETKLVAALSAQDDALERSRSGEGILLGVWQGELGSRTAQVTAGGRELVFESTQQLTGYDNSVLDETHNLEFGVEVFVYEADTGGVACASCDPSGAPPALEPGGSATYLPVSMSPTFMRRWASADGSEVFFDSSQPLSKQDTNRIQDVYEWERAGSGTCPAGSPGGGCISLLSGGDSSDNSFFVDASADGTDVFFTHRGQLGGIGRSDGHSGLLDARAGGGFDDASLACTGTGCQGVPPAPPTFATPPSATFGGTGNYPLQGKAPAKKLTRGEPLAKALKACKHKRVKRKRIVCERQARKRYGSVRATGRHAKKTGRRP